MSDPYDLVSIYEAANSIEANLVKNLLAEEEIEAVVTEANQPLAGLDITPTEVMVRRGDEDRARAFIDAYEEKLIEEAEKEDDDSDDDEDEDDDDDDDESEDE